MQNESFIRAENGQKFLHPMAHPKALQANRPLIIKEADGVHVTDIDGNRMVDGVGGLWNVNMGYNRLEIKAAIVKQLDELAYYSAFNGTSHVPGIELSTKLIDMMEPENMRRVFFSSGGSDAVETALRLARQYWKMLGQADRTKFISLKNGYHGTHFGAASVNGNTVFRRNYEPLLPGCFHVETPWLYRNPFTDDPSKLAQICADLLDREITFQGANTIAAFIAEPVQGAGGVIVPPESYWPLIREVCDKHGVLLIADEVVTGFGRTGSMFGSRGWGVKPDMMTLAKGINSGYVPLGATVINERMEEAFMQNDDGFGAIMHGYTYSGHPLACAAAIANLDLIMKEEIPQQAGEQGAYFLQQLQPFVERFNSVGDVRGKGLMLAIDMVEDKGSKAPKDPAFVKEITNVARKEGAMVRGSGHKIILSPPLVIQKEEIDVIVDALDVAFSELDR